MGLLKKEPACAFSGFEGQLLYKGEPAAGAKITRSYELFKDKGEETIYADDQGRFRFESIIVPFRTPFLAPVSFVSHQNIWITYKDETYQIWTGGKMSKEEFSELGSKPKNLWCEITEELRGIDTNGLLGTNCHWEN